MSEQKTYALRNGRDYYADGVRIDPLTEMVELSGRLAAAEALLNHERSQAIQCAAMRDALLSRLVWANVNGGQAYVLRGVDNFQLASVLVEAANKAERAERAEKPGGE